MKILIATPIYPPEIGGPATYTKELIERLSHNHKLTVVAYANTGATSALCKLCVVDKQRALPIRLWKFFLMMYKEAKHVDVIYVQNAMAAGLPTILAGIFRRKPVILKFVGDEAWERATQHQKTNKRLEEFLLNPEGGLKITLMSFIQGWVLRRCALVTTPSVYLGELIAKTYRLKKGQCITNYNAAENTTQVPFGAEKKPHQIVATARLVEWKGIEGIIEAVAQLRPIYPDVTAIIHGDGPSRENLEKLAKEKNVSDCITFTGNVSRSETWHTRKSSAVYVLNSTYEGLPHTVLTSFAAKIPIVATDIQGTDEAVYHEKSGLLVPPNNPEVLAKAIGRLFEDTALCARLVAGGDTILQEKFSWKKHIATLESFFQTVALKPRN